MLPGTQGGKMALCAVTTDCEVGEKLACVLSAKDDFCGHMMWSSKRLYWLQ